MSDSAVQPNCFPRNRMNVSFSLESFQIFWLLYHLLFPKHWNGEEGFFRRDFGWLMKLSNRFDPQKSALPEHLESWSRRFMTSRSEAFLPSSPSHWLKWWSVVCQLQDDQYCDVNKLFYSHTSLKTKQRTGFCYRLQNLYKLGSKDLLYIWAVSWDKIEVKKKKSNHSQTFVLCFIYWNPWGSLTWLGISALRELLLHSI